MIDIVRRNPVLRRVRRRGADPTGRRLDVRRTVRAMHRLDGDLLLPRFTRPRRHAQPLTFVVDVSGSMAVATRGLLLAVASFVRGEPAHEAFTFGTRLTRITPALRGSPVTSAIETAADLARDRAGGTRIGESLQQLLDAHGQPRAVRSAVVVTYSDGLERDDPDLLARQMERLALRARKVLWLNPLSSSPDYQPLARGMQAAMPYIDSFASGHDLASFEEAVSVVLQRAT